MLKNHFFYNTWNIGFLESELLPYVSCSSDTNLNIKWLKHPYRDRFFADPFILDVNEFEITILVEEFLYSVKKGVISLLTIDRKTFCLIEKNVLCDTFFHQSYPFILNTALGVLVMPEASQSGKLIAYDYVNSHLTNPRIVIDEPLLDSTLLFYNDKWWLFATKRGVNSNKDLYIYYSDFPDRDFLPHTLNPVKSDLTSSRPAGNFIIVDKEIFRLSQKCDKYYGEKICVTKIADLSVNSFNETIIGEFKNVDSLYKNGFHTCNCYKGICVVDGNKKEFAPFRRFYYESVFFLNRLMK